MKYPPHFERKKSRTRISRPAWSRGPWGGFTSPARINPLIMRVREKKGEIREHVGRFHTGGLRTSRTGKPSFSRGEKEEPESD